MHLKEDYVNTLQNEIERYKILQFITTTVAVVNMRYTVYVDSFF